MSEETIDVLMEFEKFSKLALYRGNIILKISKIIADIELTSTSKIKKIRNLLEKYIRNTEADTEADTDTDTEENRVIGIAQHIISYFYDDDYTGAMGELDIEHIGKMILDGYTSGQFEATDDRRPETNHYCNWHIEIDN